MYRYCTVLQLLTLHSNRGRVHLQGSQAKEMSAALRVHPTSLHSACLACVPSKQVLVLKTDQDGQAS